MKSAFLIALLLLLFIARTHAQVPTIINYQGRVTAGGSSFSGTGQFNFSLIKEDGSETYWHSDGVGVNVSSGLFTVRLGDTSIPNMVEIKASVFSDPSHTDVRLRVAFNDGVHGLQVLTPDTRMLAVPYAVAAKTAEFGFPMHAQEFTQAGTFDFTVPPGVTRILAEIWGAGGGTGARWGDVTAYPIPGGAGGYSRKTLSVVPGDTLKIVVGAGGLGAKPTTLSSNGVRGTSGQTDGGQSSVRTSANVTLLFSNGGQSGAFNVSTDLPVGGVGGTSDPEGSVGRSGGSAGEFGGGGKPPSGTVPPLNASGAEKINYSPPNIFSGVNGGDGYILLQW